MARASSAVEQPLVEYTGNLPDLSELESAVDQIWMQAVREDPQLRTRVGSNSPDAPAPVPFRFALTQGGDVTSVTLTVMAASSAIHLGAGMLHDLWKGVVFPQLKRRFGTVFRTPAAEVKPGRELPSRAPKKKPARKKVKTTAKRATRAKRPAKRTKKKRS
jgi:hypothetical protein